jgi:ComF family protein
VSVGWYQDELKESVRRFKFRDRPAYAAAYGPLLAQAIQGHLKGEYDVLSWVPVSPDTLKRRGYDQARLLADEAGKVLRQQTVSTLEKTGKNAPQSSLTDGRDRWSNVSGVYSVAHPERVIGRRILLVDDILTTGATLEEAAWTLRKAGAARVVAATLCRTPNKEPLERRVVPG